MNHVGVDGCPGGWVFINLNDGAYTFGVVASLEELLASLTGPASVLVDIPIGLPDGTGGRACDAAARKLIGRRRSSIFSAPQRCVLAARDYAHARELSVAACGKSLSAQSFALVPKIREVDCLLRDDARARGMLREIHPELCFTQLNGGTEMEHGKKTRAGFTERIALLEGCYPGATQIVAQAWLWSWDRKVARDDVVDAMVAAVTAHLGAQHGFATVPVTPSRDNTKLPMEMVYAKDGRR